ncbi:MAG: hypothetical protein ACLFV7_07180 [Phycisphaerae bacterium]
MSIHQVTVNYADPSRSRPRRVRVTFGDGHELEIRADGDTSIVMLATPEQSVQLTTDGRHCPYRRAVNLLRLHMPQAAR